VFHRLVALADVVGHRWTQSDSFSVRQYKSYDDYVRHQSSKLGKLDLASYDRRFTDALRDRLAGLDLAWKGASVLCLAARTGAECQAFIALGSFAVGIDLNPGRGNRHVVAGDFHSLQFADSSIDYVYTNSLDHALDLNRVACEVSRVLKPTGLFVVEIVHGTEDAGGRKPGTYESMWWTRSADVVKILRAAGYEVQTTREFQQPFNGLQAILRPTARIATRPHAVQRDAPAAGSSSDDPSQRERAPTVLYDVDEFFHQTYEAAIARSGTPDRSPTRRMRFYALTRALEATAHLDGWVAECGCWKGLSAYLICEYLRRHTPEYTGAGMVIVDSFQGLSDPGEHDVIYRDLSVKGVPRKGRPFKPPRAYAASIEHVRHVLEAYPSAELVPGWIPGVLDVLPARHYRFVHVDLDLYEPILGALRYFYPRVIRGGVLVCDDYGSLFFPGAQTAVDRFCTEVGATPVRSASGEAMIVKT
jgi:SAM-dependent methyltransferase